MSKKNKSTFEITSIIILSLFSIGFFLSALKILGIVLLPWLVCTAPIWIPCVSLTVGGLYILIALHHHDLIVVKVGEDKKKTTKSKTNNGNKTTGKRTIRTTRRTSKENSGE